VQDRSNFLKAFHAALAALTTIGIETDAISHPATQSKFNTELIHRRKIYPSRLKSYLIALQNIRNRADYKVEFLSKTLASRQLKKAKEFV